MEKKLENILFINTGGGIGDALLCLPIFKYINKNLLPKNIFYYSADLENFWFEDKLYEFRPSSLITVKNLILVKDLIKKFNFDKFDLIIDNQTRFKNTLIYKKIPHKYFISPCINFLLSKPLFFIKKNKNVSIRLIEYLNKSLKINEKPNYQIEIPFEFSSLARKIMPSDKKYIGFSITAGHPTRVKEFNLNELIKLANYYSKNFIPTFFIEKKYKELKDRLKKEIKNSFFPEELVDSKFQKPMFVTALGALTEFNITIDNGISHMLSFSNNKSYNFYNDYSKKFMPLNQNSKIFDCKLNNKKIDGLSFQEILKFIENN